MKKKSKRFEPTRYSEIIVPAVLLLLLLGLAATLGVVIINLLGWLPGA